MVFSWRLVLGAEKNNLFNFYNWFPRKPVFVLSKSYIIGVENRKEKRMWSYKEAEMLSQMCFPVKSFSTDYEDEFVVPRENNIKQGIFKAWAIPVIPFLDRGNLEILFMLWPDIVKLTKKNSFEEAIQMLKNSADPKKSENARMVTETIEMWQKRCRQYPAYLSKSLERARLFSWLLDRRLVKILNKELLSTDLPQKITQLTNRLLFAFGLMNPFYNLEAIVGDTRWLLGEESFNSSSAGKLDAVAFLLPIAFREAVISNELDWHGLTWGEIHTITAELLVDPLKRKILLNIAELAGVQPHCIVFAANALEWIPNRVGGKKEDAISTNDALEELNKIISKPEPRNKDVVATLSDINALIRFLNWVPLFEKEENFSGLDWTYASVCDVANLLLKTIVDHPEVWQDDFVKVFQDELEPQLRYLDATSAKGRFLLQLILNEKRLKDGFFGGIDKKWQQDILNSVFNPWLDAMEFQQPTRNIYPFSLVGGKPIGLTLAGLSVGGSRVLDGIVLSTNLIENFLRENPDLWEVIVRLDQTSDISQKKALSQQIEGLILKQPIEGRARQIIEGLLDYFPDTNLWAIRASSLNENEARGVYETLLQVPKNNCLEAIKKCIVSFYNQKAVFFRLTDGSGDLPSLAILLQPYRFGEGGVVSVEVGDDGNDLYSVSIGRTAAGVTSGEAVFKEWKGSFEELTSPAEVKQVVQAAQQIRRIFGPVQLEWVKNPQTQDIIILQMERISVSSTSVKTHYQPIRHRFKLQSLVETEINRLLSVLKETDSCISLELDQINLDAFQGELFAIIAQFRSRIVEIRIHKAISSASHFANICRHFNIKLQII